jgi:hypothetical protein
MIEMNSSVLLVIMARKTRGSPATASFDGPSDRAIESPLPQAPSGSSLNALPIISLGRAEAPCGSLGA